MRKPQPLIATAANALRIKPLRPAQRIDGRWRLVVGDEVAPNCTWIPRAACMTAAVAPYPIDLETLLLGEVASRRRARATKRSPRIDAGFTAAASIRWSTLIPE